MKLAGARLPPAPPRFWMTIAAPSFSAATDATMRALMSAPPPGENAT
jgi:hypothetical protein